MSRPYSVVIAASKPPPLAGQSIATAMLLDYLAAEGIDYSLINLSRPFYQHRWRAAVRRSADMIKLPVLGYLAAGAPGHKIFYLQLGQSRGSLLRDVALLMLAEHHRLPLVVHVHGGGFRAAMERAPMPLSALVCHSLRRAACAIVLTHRLRDMFAGILPDSKIRVVSNGVERYIVDHAASSSRFVSSTRMNVLFLGNLIHSKGYVAVLRAAKRCQELALPISFEIAGSRTESTTTDPGQFICEHDLKNCRYAGPLDRAHKAQALAKSDVLLLPTAYPIEGQPISILEAMHYGNVIVTTRTGGIPDVVDDGVHGFYVAPGDVEAIVRILQLLLTSPQLRARMATTNRQHAAQSFTDVAHGKAMVRIFDDVASRGTREVREEAPG